MLDIVFGSSPPFPPSSRLRVTSGKGVGLALRLGGSRLFGPSLEFSAVRNHHIFNRSVVLVHPHQGYLGENVLSGHELPEHGIDLITGRQRDEESRKDQLGQGSW